MKTFLQNCVGALYKFAVKPVLFLFDPETVHNRVTEVGEMLGNFSPAKKVLRWVFASRDKTIQQNICGLNFKTPVGLAAGFDYEASLTGILPSLGFGFESIGTLTNLPYEGNPKPILGRLPRSKSLMVNKGFKNLGVSATLSKFNGREFSYPVGVSIGKTNTPNIKTQGEAITDILAAFRLAENSAVKFSYYELNISCPNLAGEVDFYEPAHLEELLTSVEKLRLNRPVFVKMPISKTDVEILAMMNVIARHQFVKAVVVGNLQRDKNHPNIIPEEAAKFAAGSWSGLPCQSRSNELIKLVYERFGSRIRIIGCGGIFPPADAYLKIRLGASLVQLVTGLIFEGPQLIAEINRRLSALIRADGFSHISEAIGAEAKGGKNSSRQTAPRSGKLLL